MKKITSLLALSLLLALPNMGMTATPHTENVGALDSSSNEWGPLVKDGNKLLVKTAADINLDTGSLKLVDSDGDEWDINADGEGRTFIENQGTGEAIPVEITNYDTSVSIESSVPLDRNWKLNPSQDSVQVITESTKGNDKTLKSDDTGRLLVVSREGDTFIVKAQQDGTWTVDRTWSLNSSEDTVNLAQGNIETTNDTDVGIVRDDVGLAKDSTLSSVLQRKITNQDTDVNIVSAIPLDRNWTLDGASDSVKVSNPNQVGGSSDTDVVVHAFGSDTITAIDNALRVSESRPQRSIFDESSGETAAVKKGGLSTREHEMAEDTVVVRDMAGGDTIGVNISNAEQWELKTSGSDVYYSTANNAPDTNSGMVVFDQTGTTEEGVGGQQLTIYSPGSTTVWIRVKQ